MKKIALLVGFVLSGVAYAADSPVVLAKSLIPTLVEDLRYATADNFLHAAVYTDNRCWLKKSVVDKLAVAARHLDERRHGLRLKVWDCYRPRAVQCKMWKIVKDPRYVADPRKGSRHNTGNAVDLTIVDVSGGEVEMPTEFDNFTPKAWPNAPTTPEAAANRELLRVVMEQAGFKRLKTEWWHFDG